MAGIGATTRVGDGNWIPGCTPVSSVGGLGVLAQNVSTVVGPDGTCWLFDSLEFPGDTDCEVRQTLVVGLANGGTLTLDENGPIGYAGGADSIQLQGWRAGLPVGTPKLVTFSASGAPSTITGISISPTAASGAVTFAKTLTGSGAFSSAATFSKISGGGSIDPATGAFVSPAANNSIQIIVVRVTSTQDPNFFAEATITIAAAASSPGAFATTATFSVVDAVTGAAITGLVGLDYAFYDQARIKDAQAPVKKGATLAINGGTASIDITGVTALAPGQTGRVEWGTADGTKAGGGQVVVS